MSHFGPKIGWLLSTSHMSEWYYAHHFLQIKISIILCVWRKTSKIQHLNSIDFGTFVYELVWNFLLVLYNPKIKYRMVYFLSKQILGKRNFYDNFAFCLVRYVNAGECVLVIIWNGAPRRICFYGFRIVVDVLRTFVCVITIYSTIVFIGRI